MKIFVFEYATAVNDKNLNAEGRAMRNLIIHGLKKEGIDTCTISGTMSNNTDNNSHHLYEKILKNVYNSDNTILIAPNYELLEISNFLNRHNIFDKVLISPIDALNKTLNKFSLYKELKGKVLVPKTTKFPSHADFPKIIKPIYGTGCESTYVFKDNEYYERFVKTGKQKFNENFIVQEFIDGIHTSVCLFAGKEVYPVSLNKQYINFDKGKVQYNGGVVPFQANEYIKSKIFEYSKLACMHLGLKGYIGMDFVIETKNEKIYLIEINPRITTSAIALSKATNLNIAKLHIACFKDEEILRKELSKVKFSNVVEILKYKCGMKCRIKK